MNGNTTAFYATLAGIVPVLMLAAAVEFHWFRELQEGMNTGPRFRAAVVTLHAFFFISALTLEVGALLAILHGDGGNDGIAKAMLGGLILSFGVLNAVAAIPYLLHAVEARVTWGHLILASLPIAGAYTFILVKTFSW